MSFEEEMAALPRVCNRIRIGTALASTIVVGVIAIASAIACAPQAGPPTRVTIPQGSTFRAAADSLAHAGVISYPRLFRLYARFTGTDRTIQAGTYQLPRGMEWGDAVAALNNGEGIINRITIPEGYSIAQMAPLLERLLQIPADSFIAASKDSLLRAQLNVPAGSLEGYLFPDTYVLAPGTAPSKIISEMVKRFEREWKPEYDAQASAMGLTRHQILTMASIVEKEAKVPSERPTIAGVYYNRLKRNMPLQADPTVQYALGKHVDRVLYKDLDVESAYNTYRHAGWPPGPIASPGSASIAAALNPANVPYLYFVATPDGHHKFSATLSAHDQAIREIRGESTKASPAEPKKVERPPSKSDKKKTAKRSSGRS